MIQRFMHINHIKINNNVLKKLRNKVGASFAELLTTIALMGIMGAMVVGIIPVVQSVMNTITTKARAEMLLNNTAVVLKDSMRYAQNVKNVNIGGKNTVQFVGADDWTYRISVGDDNWINIAPIKKSSEGENPLGITSTIIDNWHIVTNEAASQKLIPTYESIEYDEDSNQFEITGLKIIENVNGSTTTRAYYRGVAKEADGTASPKIFVVTPLG